MNDRLAAQMRQHLLETADVRPADGQLASVIDGVAATAQRHSLLARLTWSPGRIGPLPSAAIRYGLIAVALALATVAGGSLAGGARQASSVFEGTWITIDPVDGSGMTLVVGPGQAPAVYFEDGYATGLACVNDAVKRFTARGIGEISGKRLVATFPEGGGCGLKTVEVRGSYDYDPRGDTLSDQDGVVWTRALSTADPTPSPSPSSSPAQVVDFPDLTKTFVSPRNGFAVRHFDRGDGTVTPAKQLWGFSQQVDDGFDVVETGSAAVFKGASTEMPDVENGFLVGEPSDISIDEWVDEYVSPGGCGVPRSQQAEITIDGQSGRISECPNQIEATVVAGGRLYLFTLLHTRSDARAFFDAFAATIDLTPETAVDFPNLTTTFVSPTNGYSFKYIRGLAPAKELWDPVTQPRPDNSGVHDDPFDVVETALGAVFKGASTVIPDGVSIDAWVDEYVSPGGCGVPRSQQAEITIDGQSGRISECPNEIEATVVAGGRLYLFTLLHTRSDARAFFDAFVATIDLRPEEAALPSISPSP
jgi:hypothetical protein